MGRNVSGRNVFWGETSYFLVFGKKSWEKCLLGRNVAGRNVSGRNIFQGETSFYHIFTYICESKVHLFEFYTSSLYRNLYLHNNLRKNFQKFWIYVDLCEIKDFYIEIFIFTTIYVKVFRNFGFTWICVNLKISI